MKILFLFFLISVTQTGTTWGCAAKYKKDIHAAIASLKKQPSAATTEPASEVKVDNEKQKPASTTPVDGDDDGTLVATKFGQLRGHTLSSRRGLKYVAFRGVPFAEKPERFEAAQQFRSAWSGVRDAQEFGSVCPQTTGIFGQGNVTGDEDCLFLNIYLPSPDRCKENENPTKLPIMVLVPPTNFGSGAKFGPHYLMDECVVFVQMNYRIGALGFLATNDPTVFTPNLGLRDQILALKWIQNHIQNFRGDPQSVTLIGGDGTSSTAIGHLVTAPGANGLFHRIITASGSALNPFALVRNPEEQARNLGKLLNCTISRNPTNFSSNLKKCLKTVDYKDIVKYQDVSRKWVTKQPVFEINFGPVLEKALVSNSDASESAHEPILTDHPFVRLQNGNFSKVPMLSGLCQDEGYLFQAGGIIKNKEALRKLNTIWNRVAPLHLMYDEVEDLSDSESNMISNKIRQFYFGEDNIDEKSLANLTDLNSDRYFNHGILKNFQLHSKFAPVYPYIFRFPGRFSWSMPILGTNDPVLSHGSDSQYIFRFDFVPEHEPGSPEEMISEKMIKMWTSFAKLGDPAKLSENLKWDPFDEAKDEILEIKDASNMKMLVVKKIFKDRMSFWDSTGLADKEFATILKNP